MPYTVCKQVPVCNDDLLPGDGHPPGLRDRRRLRAADGLQAGPGRGLRQGARVRALRSPHARNARRRAWWRPRSANSPARRSRSATPATPSIRCSARDCSAGSDRRRFKPAFDRHERPRSDPGAFALAPGALLRVNPGPGASAASRSQVGQARTARDQPDQHRPEPGEGARAVAELVLDQGAQLAEGLVVLGDQEQGIIAESVPPRGSRMIRPRQARRLRSRIAPDGSASARAQTNAAPRCGVGHVGSGPRAPCGCSPRRRRARPRSGPRRPRAHRRGHRPPGPSRRRGPSGRARGPSRSPSCGRWRRTSAPSSTTSGTSGCASSVAMRRRSSRGFGSHGGRRSCDHLLALLAVPGAEDQLDRLRAVIDVRTALRTSTSVRWPGRGRSHVGLLAVLLRIIKGTRQL